MCLSSVRDLTNDLAGHCFDYGEEPISFHIPYFLSKISLSWQRLLRHKLNVLYTVSCINNRGHLNHRPPLIFSQSCNNDGMYLKKKSAPGT